MWGQKKPIRKARGTKVDWKGGKKPQPTKPKKYQMRPVFNDPTVGAAIRNRARPAGYQQPPEVSDALEAAMVPGGSVVALQDLALGEKGVYPLHALVRHWPSGGQAILIVKGSLLMYAGAVRATERKWVTINGITTHKDVSVFKHTFITPHGHCIIHDFSLIAPV